MFSKLHLLLDVKLRNGEYCSKKIVYVNPDYLCKFSMIR